MAEPNTEEWMQNIEFINERQRVLFAEARFGELVKDFLMSDVGRYLHGRSKVTVDNAMKKMLDLDANADDFAKQFKDLQEEAYHAEHFMKWLADALTDAELAAQNLENEDLLS